MFCLQCVQTVVFKHSTMYTIVWWPIILLLSLTHLVLSTHVKLGQHGGEKNTWGLLCAEPQHICSPWIMRLCKTTMPVQKNTYGDQIIHSEHTPNFSFSFKLLASYYVNHELMYILSNQMHSFSPYISQSRYLHIWLIQKNHKQSLLD